MYWISSYYLLLLVISFVQVHCSWDWIVDISHNGPIVSGGTITFKATIKPDGDGDVNGEFKYLWEDNAFPQHQNIIESKSTKLEWNVTYAKDKYYPGNYEMQLKVEKKYFLVFLPIASGRIGFGITALLNGDFKITQNNKEIANDTYVALDEESTFIIDLKEADMNYVKHNATQIDTYIFMNCQYVNDTNGLVYKYNFTNNNVEHLIEVLTVVSFDPPVIIPTTPVPPSHNTTNMTSSSTLSPISTVVNELDKIHNSSLYNVTVNGTTNSNINGSLKLEEISINEITPNKLTTMVPSVSPATTTTAKSITSTKLPPIAAFPYVCNNSTSGSPDISKTYGYYQKRIKVEAAIKNIKADGNVWLKHGDMLNLDIKCNGSGPFKFCAQFVPGAYNISGDESCIRAIENKDQCSFHIDHYFRETQEYTLVVVISNNVGKVVTPVGINIYEVTKHAQLSVIVVPVFTSLLAVILIVFGLAYYIQSRDRFRLLIEEADFDFSNTSTDLEYKTFRERLREAISSAINKPQDYNDQDSNIWTPPDQSSGRRYGSMQ